MPPADKLAVHGGTPVRDMHRRPWPTWPVVSEQLWRDEVEPALKATFLSAVEGLPSPRSKQFGGEMAAYCGSKFGVMVPHGTDAISAAVAAVLDLDGWEHGGEIILPNYTFIATASAPLDRRCPLAFVDIDPDTLTLCPKALEAAIRPGKTKAILVVHLAGHPADMPEILRIAAKAGIPVIEDCAQAHGAEVEGRKVGSLGKAGAFSFQSTKNLTSGEGGCVTTDDEDVRNRVVSFMDVGRQPAGRRWDYARLGWNYRPSEYLASLLSIRLRYLEEETRRRAANADYLSERLRQIPGVTPPTTAPWVTLHGYHLYAMKVDPAHFGGKSRDAIVEALTAEGIPSTAGYETPLSEQAALQHLAKKYPDLMRVEPYPNASAVCRSSIWTYQNVLLADRKDMDDVVEAFAKVQRAMCESA
jgi:dTDP-4-amino-4,6-dideoxygalactose transaminase